MKGVSNLINLKPRTEPSEIKRKIQEAFRRNAEVVQIESRSKRMAAR